MASDDPRDSIPRPSMFPVQHLIYTFRAPELAKTPCRNLHIAGLVHSVPTWGLLRDQRLMAGTMIRQKGRAGNRPLIVSCRFIAPSRNQPDVKMGNLRSEPPLPLPAPPGKPCRMNQRIGAHEFSSHSRGAKSCRAARRIPTSDVLAVGGESLAIHPPIP